MDRSHYNTLIYIHLIIYFCFYFTFSTKLHIFFRQDQLISLLTFLFLNIIHHLRNFKRKFKICEIVKKKIVVYNYNKVLDSIFNLILLAVFSWINYLVGPM